MKQYSFSTLAFRPLFKIPTRLAGATLFVIIFLFALAPDLAAQSTLLKVLKTTNDINNANNAANSATNALGNTGQAVGNVKSTFKGLFGSKKNKEPKSANMPGSSAENKINLTISGIDYTNLKTLEDSIKTISGVTSTSRQFHQASSSIEVAYSDEADKLWDSMSQQIRDLYTLKDLNSGSISLEIKK